MSTEAGSIGGTLGRGLLFGAAFNPSATLPSATILDYYQGGAIDLACLGAAEVDSQVTWLSSHKGVSNFITKTNTAAVNPSATILDYYQGGAIDLACPGAAEVNPQVTWLSSRKGVSNVITKTKTAVFKHLDSIK